MRVLLIEDDSATAQSIELMLKSESFNVYTTDLGEEGIDLGKLYDYDIILLDLNLPDMTGWSILEFIKSLYADRPESELPKVIVLTAYNDPANRLVGKLQEVFRFLVKTTTPLELQAVIREALAER